MDAKQLRAKAEDALRKSAPKIEKGISSAEKFAKDKTKNNPSRTRQVDQAAGKLRGMLGKAQGR